MRLDRSSSGSGKCCARELRLHIALYSMVAESHCEPDRLIKGVVHGRISQTRRTKKKNATKLIVFSLLSCLPKQSVKRLSSSSSCPMPARNASETCQNLSLTIISSCVIALPTPFIDSGMCWLVRIGISIRCSVFLLRAAESLRCLVHFMTFAFVAK